MAFSVIMPALEMGQETGKLISWLKREGESVTKGEPLLEVETDKAVLEVEAPADGFLVGVKAQQGSVIPVGQTIAWIVKAGEDPPFESASTDSSAERRAGSGSFLSGQSELPGKPVAAEIKISPKARRMAKERGIDIGSVRGSGADGEILASDLDAAGTPGNEVSVGPKSPGLSNDETLSSIGRLMAERTTQSWTTVPHFFVTREVDASALLQARKELSADKQPEVKVTITDFLIALVARALVKHPRINASWSGSGIHHNPEVNIAIAIAVNDGVVAAVVHNANTLRVEEIAMQRQLITERARAGKLRPADIEGPTFTISNLGMYRVDSFSAIISPPQAAILAVGAVIERVVPVAGRPEIRPMITFTLSCDHRLIDGARAASFLNEVAEAVGIFQAITYP